MSEDAVCLGCGMRVGDDAACACARVDAPYRSAEQGPTLGRCPRCSSVLDEVEYAGTPIDECGACGGAFVEGWILDRLVEARAARLSLAISLPVRAVAREREVRYLRCPRCVVQMNRRIYGRSSGIVVDVCKQHGVWFDAGELSAVLEFVEGGGLERARKKEEEERRELERRERVRRELEPSPTSRMLHHQPVSTRSELAFDLVTTILEWWQGR